MDTSPGGLISEVFHNKTVGGKKLSNLSTRAAVLRCILRALNVHVE